MADCPSFTLKPSDISAPLIIDVWTLVQQRLAAQVFNGFTPEQAILNVRTTLGIPPYVPDIWHTEKLRSASRIAREMEQAEGRRLAD